MIWETYNPSVEQEVQIRKAAKRLGFWPKTNEHGLHVRAPEEFHKAVEFYLLCEGSYANLSLIDIYNKLSEPVLP